MNIRLLGTGAADGIPAFYSNSRVSRYAREHGGKDIRTRCAALVDGVLKIDLPPDTLVQMHRDRLDPLDWTALLFTHSDDDHFAVAELQYGLHPFNDMGYMGFTIYGNQAIADRIWSQYPDWPLEVVVTHSFQPFRHSDYTITPIKAMHKCEEDSHNLIIQKGDQTLLYATDTGYWEEESWEFLQDFKLDLLVIECTEGFCGTPYNGHLDIDELGQVTDRLRKDSIIGDSTHIVTTHHSHSGEATHAELEKALVSLRAEPGYDGMVVSIP